jgi:hypothetical protein
MNWIPVDFRLPAHNTNVLATYKNSHGKRRVIVAHYLERWKEESFSDENNDEYSEELDIYYLKEGWYENLENWDYSSVVVSEGEVSHWMPLPEWPEGPT